MCKPGGAARVLKSIFTQTASIPTAMKSWSGFPLIGAPNVSPVAVPRLTRELLKVNLHQWGFQACVGTRWHATNVRNISSAKEVSEDSLWTSCATLDLLGEGYHGHCG